MPTIAEQGLPGGGRVQAGQAVHQRRLARPGGPHHGGEGAGTEVVDGQRLARSDRGNAILSSLPLADAVATELPFSMQRRVAVSASVAIGAARIRLHSAHLDPRGRGARDLFGFAGRLRQAHELIRMVHADADTPHLIGADLNLAWPTAEVAVVPTADESAVPASPSSSPWVLVALVATGFFASIAATSLPSYIASTGLDTGLSPGLVAGAQVLGSIACAATRIGVPLAISHGTARHRLRLISVMLAGGTIGYLLLGTGAALGFLIGTVVAYTFGWGWNGLFNQVVVAVRPDSIAAATGMTQGGVFLGGTVGPLAFAAVVHAHGYEPAWMISAGAAFAAVLTVSVAAALLRERPAS